ncbi:hypothetical protein O0544_08835 [Edwardsiella anguillarum]|nr:hypothetical protein [Edwardsiella anguillarum]
MLAAEQIAPGAGVGIEVQERFVLLLQRRDDQALDGVLKNVGVVAGMKTVTVT